MKKGVLYIFHGSRLRDSREEAIHFFNEVKASLPYEIQEISFLELAKPTIEEGFASCFAKGAAHIAVIPVLLLAAGHAKQDIPAILSTLQTNYPEAMISYGMPFGVDELMLEAVEDRIKRVLNRPKKSRMILIGRGSRDVEMQQDFLTIGRMLEERLEVPVTCCYLTAASPLFQDVVQSVPKMTEEEIIFVPYLLFTGLLLKGVQKQIEQLQRVTNKKIMLTDHIGNHSAVKELLRVRVEEAFAARAENKYLKKETVL
ncbi:sirohydrochlorin ferrochelatase [Aeribacillus pallidus]|jgi:sirohydrochlorin ferrochelatase|nr:sirohydrochlorin ferrochelatase [Aeribacillus pallidus]